MSEPKNVERLMLDYFDNLCQREKPLVWIATISRDGRPHIAPTCFVKPVGDGKLAVGGVFIKQTVNNLLRNPSIALGAVKFTDGYDGYMIKGRGEIFESGEQFESLKEAVYGATKGRRTIKWMILVSVKNVYSLKPMEGKKKII